MPGSRVESLPFQTSLQRLTNQLLRPLTLHIVGTGWWYRFLPVDSDPLQAEPPRLAPWWKKAPRAPTRAIYLAALGAAPPTIHSAPAR
jgi:hypothetical protein